VAPPIRTQGPLPTKLATAQPCQAARPAKPAPPRRPAKLGKTDETDSSGALSLSRLMVTGALDLGLARIGHHCHVTRRRGSGRLRRGGVHVVDPAGFVRTGPLITLRGLVLDGQQRSIQPTTARLAGSRMSRRRTTSSASTSRTQAQATSSATTSKTQAQAVSEPQHPGRRHRSAGHNIQDAGTGRQRAATSGTQAQPPRQPQHPGRRHRPRQGSCRRST
jgi:hypothetical protein